MLLAAAGSMQATPSQFVCIVICSLRLLRRMETLPPPKSLSRIQHRLSVRPLPGFIVHCTCCRTRAPVFNSIACRNRGAVTYCCVHCCSELRLDVAGCQFHQCHRGFSVQWQRLQRHQLHLYSVRQVCCTAGSACASRLSACNGGTDIQSVSSRVLHRSPCRAAAAQFPSSRPCFKGLRKCRWQPFSLASRTAAVARRRSTGFCQAAGPCRSLGRMPLAIVPLLKPSAGRWRTRQAQITRASSGEQPARSYQSHHHCVAGTLNSAPALHCIAVVHLASSPRPTSALLSSPWTGLVKQWHLQAMNAGWSLDQVPSWVKPTLLHAAHKMQFPVWCYAMANDGLLCRIACRYRPRLHGVHQSGYARSFQHPGGAV